MPLKQAPRLCWNAIVKNEADKIERAATSVMPWIECAVIMDTGSTDGTIDKLKELFEFYKKPLFIGQCEFKDFSQARNEALRAARMYKTVIPYDWIMLMDADMELRVNHSEWRDLIRGPSCDMYQTGSGTYYVNRRFVSPDVTNEYWGVTHEYLNCETGGVIDRNVVFFEDHADGTNRKDKFKRDIKLLKQGLKDNPKCERYMYYLAQSYKDAGNYEKAIKWYQERVKAGGWDEEVWHAQYCLACVYKLAGDEKRFITNMLEAYNMRPSRAEAPYQLANHYRHKGQNALGTLMAKATLEIPRPNDMLFIEDFPYAVGGKEEYSICGFYMPRERERAMKVTDILCLENQPWQGPREQAKDNMFHYLKPLNEFCPSWTTREIPFTPEPNWVAMNPSVTRRKDGRIVCNVRTVNYAMDDDGRYTIRDGNRWPSDDDPIRTRNFLLDFGFDPFSQTVPPPPREILAPPDLPVNYKGVIGFEDMRIFEWKDQLWSVSAVRQLANDTAPEQVLARIGDDNYLTDIKKMLPNFRACEKNWMPFVQDNGDKLEFMYRLGITINSDGEFTKQVPTGILSDQIAGGSQMVPFDDGWLCVVHEARPIPGRSIRFYQHRFAWLDYTLTLKKLSLPFFLKDRVIEYVAGACWAPDDKHILMSFGFRDKEALIGRVHHSEIRKMLWSS